MKENDIFEKIKEANGEMFLKTLEFIKQNGYNSYEDMIKNGYKINYHTQTEKTDDGYRITLIPFLEKIISFENN